MFVSLRSLLCCSMVLVFTFFIFPLSLCHSYLIIFQDKKTGEITNTQRIVAALPTINAVLDRGAKSVVLMSHLGRPNGQKNAKFTLKPVADKLAELIHKPVLFVPDCVGDEVERACADPTPGSIILLENMRYYAEEEGKGVHAESGDKFTPSDDAVAAFRASLAKLGDVYVCDAFGTAHRGHSSMVGLSGKMPCVSGLLLAKELAAFSKVLDPALKKTPLTSIVGGAKISDKVKTNELQCNTAVVTQSTQQSVTKVFTNKIYNSSTTPSHPIHLCVSFLFLPRC